MAKRKKRRPSSGPGGGTRAATSTRERTQRAPAVKPAPATPGGPNRIERKELARQQREALRRKMARQRFARRGGVWAAAAAAVAVAILLIVQASGGSGPLNKEEKKLLAEAPAAARQAGAGAVTDVAAYNPQNLDRAHIGSANGPSSMPALSSYPSHPPASGPHNDSALAAGQYPDPPPIDQVIHSLEHGAVVIWYDPSALSTKALTDLQSFFLKSRERGKVIIAPYNYPDQGPAGKLPAGKKMVLIAWHRMQVSTNVSLPVAFQFVYHYNSGFGPGDYRGVAPEPTAQI